MTNKIEEIRLDLLVTIGEREYKFTHSAYGDIKQNAVKFYKLESNGWRALTKEMYDEFFLHYPHVMMLLSQYYKLLKKRCPEKFQRPVEYDDTWTVP